MVCGTCNYQLDGSTIFCRGTCGRIFHADKRCSGLGLKALEQIQKHSTLVFVCTKCKVIAASELTDCFKSNFSSLKQEIESQANIISRLKSDVESLNRTVLELSPPENSTDKLDAILDAIKRLDKKIITGRISDVIVENEKHTALIMNRIERVDQRLAAVDTLPSLNDKVDDLMLNLEQTSLRYSSLDSNDSNNSKNKAINANRSIADELNAVNTETTPMHPRTRSFIVSNLTAESVPGGVAYFISGFTGADTDMIKVKFLPPTNDLSHKAYIFSHGTVIPR